MHETTRNYWQNKGPQLPCLVIHTDHTFINNTQNKENSKWLQRQKFKMAAQSIQWGDNYKTAMIIRISLVTNGLRG